MKDTAMQLFSKKKDPSSEAETLQKKLNEEFVTAARNNDPEKVKKFYEQGAEVNYQDKNGNTALYEGALRYNFEIVKFLVETAKADITIINNAGSTAADHSTNNIKRYLLQIGEKQKEQQKPTGWIKVTNDTIAHVVFGESIGYRLTEVFNFSSRTYVHITQNLETKAENKTLTVFDEFGNKSFLLNALQELKNQGGTAEESAIEGKHHLAKDTFGAKR
jgi:ankyrin repeat protein